MKPAWITRSHRAKNRGARTLVATAALLLMAASAQVRVAAIDAPMPVIAAAPIERPGYLEQITDPAFGTPLVRITDPGAKLLPGVACAPTACRHRYSSAQAWNADQTLLVISTGCPGLCFLDGQTYRPLFKLRPPGSCHWHPLDPDRMVCVSDDQVYSLSVRSRRYERIFASDDLRGLRFGPGKGNLSIDGGRLVVRAIRSGRMVAFAYDISSARKFPEIALDRLEGENSYCSISPSGNHVFCYQKRTDGTNTGHVFTVAGDLLQSWTEHHRPGHGDMTLDADGRDVYVGISKSTPDKFQVIKRRLDDGKVTVLTARGFAQHASIRNVSRPGWVFVTFGGTLNAVSERRRRLPFYQEIVALRLDGSGDARRIVHTRSVEHDYVSEAHASPSPDGSQVIWASNWGQPGAPVASYVARVSWPAD
jgi:hypothetical protein